MLNRASSMYGTGPEPTTKCLSSSKTSHDEPGDINPYAYFLYYRVQYNSIVARRDTLNPDTDTESMIS